MSDLPGPLHPWINDESAKVVIEVISKAAGLEARRLLLWILAWAGLSAAWQIDDNLDPGIELRVAEMAWAALNT